MTGGNVTQFSGHALSVLVAVVHPRHAVRRPHRLRLRGSVRQARAGRCAGRAGMLEFDLFKRVVDEAGPSLVRIDFFSDGEAFLHKRAVEMCEYIKANFPHIYLYTSTNGLALSEAQARRLVHSGIDEVTFSIDGATAESYVKYRQRGKFDLAIANLRAMADEKKKA